MATGALSELIIIFLEEVAVRMLFVALSICHSQYWFANKERVERTG